MSARGLVAELYRQQEAFQQLIVFGPEWCYVLPVKSLVYLTTRIPSKLVSDLESAGYSVFEALEVSEVLHLCEHQNIDAVVIGAEIADADVIEVQMRQITIRLEPETTSKDLIAELWQLFPDKQLWVQ